MTNPCDVGMCDPSRCHDKECMGEGKRKEPNDQFIDHICNQQEDNSVESISQ